jgi:predicted anti-sigma-YlaC factor YlaD
VRPDEREVAGLTCAEVMHALSDYAEGDVPADLRVRIEAHVAGCRQCEEFGAAFTALLAGMRRQLATPDVVDDDVVARVRRAITASAS